MSAELPISPPCSSGARCPRSPRYVMVEGRPAYKDKCIDHWPMRLRSWLTRTAIYSVFFESVFGGAGPADMDLYVAVLIRAGQLARERYGVPPSRRSGRPGSATSHFPGTAGRLLSIVMMIVGVSLFVRMVQVRFRSR